MKRIYLKPNQVQPIRQYTMLIILAAAAGMVASGSTMVHATEPTQQAVSTMASTQTTQNTPQAAAYGGGGSVARAASHDDNLMLPSTSKPVVEKTPVYKLTTFPEMRRGLEKLFDSYVTQTGGQGPLYTSQVYKYGTSLGDEPTNKPTFSGFMGTKYSQQYLAKQGMSQELANLAKYTFKDVKGTEWYANLIPLSVYYGVVNGYEDGTFRGTQPVTRAELAVILANYKDAGNSSTFTSMYNGAWYAGSLDMLNSSPLSANRLNKTSITEGATRGEVAMILASFCAGEQQSKYYNDITQGKLKTYVFKDVKGYVNSIEEDRENNIIKDVSGYYPAYKNKLKNPSKPPTDVLAAMLALNEVNVMQGDSAGNSNWTKTVTRAEVLAFIQKMEMMSSTLTR